MPAPPPAPSPVPPAASYSTTEAAQRLGVSKPTVQRWVDLGHLKAWKTVGGHRRIDAASLERFIADPGLPARERAAAAAPSVLVVDDDPSDRDVIVALAEAALPGAVISAVETGFDALLAIGQAVPDVLVTDIVMPHMNGFEMLRRLAQPGAARPAMIVAVSAHTPAQFARLGSLPPEVRFVPKPIDPQQFIEILRTALRRPA